MTYGLPVICATSALSLALRFDLPPRKGYFYVLAFTGGLGVGLVGIGLLHFGVSFISPPVSCGLMDPTCYAFQQIIEQRSLSLGMVPLGGLGTLFSVWGCRRIHSWPGSECIR